MLITILWIIGLLVGALLLVYFLAPGVVYRWAMAMGRRQGGLQLKQIVIDGHDTPYLCGGSGPPLVLLHGFGANKDHWTLIAPFLTRHFQVFAPDLPGFGDSERKNEARYGVAEQLQRIDEFADALGLDRFHLGGNSMGGYLSLMFAHANPERVESLWLLAPAGAMSAEPSEVLHAIENGENPLIATTLEEFNALGDLCFTVMPPMPTQFKRHLLRRSQFEAPFNQRIFEHMFDEPVSLEDTLADLGTRSLLVWGDNDRVLHPSGLEIIAARLSNVETVLMNRMGHVPMLERPAETAADYLRFRGITTG